MRLGMEYQDKTVGTILNRYVGRQSARHARCSSTVVVVLPVRETLTAAELDSDVADIKLIKLIIFTYYILDFWYKYIFNNKSKTLLP